MTAASNRKNTLHTDQYFWPVVMLGPCVLGLAIFTYLPTLGSLGLSFSYWNLLGQPQWVGLDNYQGLMSDPLFWQSLWVTGQFVVMTAIAEVVLGMILAVFLNQAVKGYLQTSLRAAYFIPVITPMVSVALVWGWLYEPEQGLLNWALKNLHVIQSSIPWLYDKNTALFAVALLRVWKGVGYTMLLLLAGLQGISPSLYESAELDGASPWQQFWKVTLPMMTPTLFFVLTVTFINAFQVFDAVFLLTQGGPEHSTDLLVYWLFKNAFEFYKIGPASAMAYILFAIILVLTLVQWRIRKHWVLYEDEVA